MPRESVISTRVNELVLLTKQTKTRIRGRVTNWRKRWERRRGRKEEEEGRRMK